MYQYSFNQVHLIVTIGGLPIPIINVPDQAQIFTIGRRAATRHDVMGARGEMNVATTVNYSGVLSFPLMQTAPENIALSGFQIQAENDGKRNPLGTDVINAYLTDLTSLGTFGNCNGGYFPGPPVMVRGNTVNFLMWNIAFEKINLNHGGNIPTPGTDITQYI
jgi:hypothetical protein